MLEKPDLSDDRLLACLLTNYGLRVEDLTFLPLGADVDTAVYRAIDESGDSYFVKLRRGDFDGATVLVPPWLSFSGNPNLIPPIETMAGRPWTHVAEYTVVLYRFVEGENGFDRQLSDQQWINLGASLRHMHSAHLPDDLAARLPREDYSPRWREQVRAFQERVEAGAFADQAAEQMAAVMRANRDTITLLVDRAEELAAVLRNEQRAHVLCHGDIHAGNVLTTDDGWLGIVDWDTLCIAPKERDLMFIGAGIGSVWETAREEELFYEGYGVVEVNRTALSYYRYERIVQDIAAYGEQLLVTDEGGEDREQSLWYFASQFRADDVIEIAMRSDRAPV